MQPVMEAFGEIDKKLGEERKALDAAYSGTIELSGAQMWSLNYDLSFAPENPRIQPEEENFTDWLFVYFKPGTEEKVQALGKKWNALYKSKNLEPPSTRVLIGDFGTEGPVRCFVDAGESAVGCCTPNGLRSEKVMGKEQEELEARDGRVHQERPSTKPVVPTICQSFADSIFRTTASHNAVIQSSP